MSSKQSRLELLIDVFELEGQPARVLPKIKPPQLVEAIVQEFRELEILDGDPSGYYLVKASDQTPLDDEAEMGRQRLSPGARLVLQEREPPLPAGAQPFSRRIYLREQSADRVFRLHWQPAIVGRSVDSQPHGDALPDSTQWVAVDLRGFPTGLRVSRRHLAISESDDQLTVENLAPNPAAIQHGAEQIAIEEGKVALHDGDLILLERSQLALKVIIRNRHASPVEDAAGEAHEKLQET